MVATSAVAGGQPKAVGVSLGLEGEHVDFWIVADRVARLRGWRWMALVIAVIAVKLRVRLCPEPFLGEPVTIPQRLVHHHNQRRAARQTKAARRHLARVCGVCGKHRRHHARRGGRRIGYGWAAIPALRPARGPSLVLRARPARLGTRFVQTTHTFTPRWTDDDRRRADAYREAA